MDAWKYIHTDDAECATELGVDYPGIVLTRFFDNELFQVQEAESLSSAELSAVLTLRQMPELIPFSEEFIQSVMQEERTSLVMFTNNVNRDKVKPFFMEYEKAAHEMFGTFEKGEELLFVVSGISFGIQIRIAEVVGAKEEDLPALYMMQPKKDAMTEKWKFTDGSVEDLTVEKVRSFINDFRNSNLMRVYKSEPAPETVSGPKEVKKIVGQTWAAEVNDSTKDVFVLYISEYCRECRDLEEPW